MQKIPFEWAIAFAMGGAVLIFLYGLLAMAIVYQNNKPYVIFLLVIAGGALGYWFSPFFLALGCQYISADSTLVQCVAVIIGTTTTIIAAVIAMQRTNARAL